MIDTPLIETLEDTVERAMDLAPNRKSRLPALLLTLLTLAGIGALVWFLVQRQQAADAPRDAAPGGYGDASPADTSSAVSAL